MNQVLVYIKEIMKDFTHSSKVKGSRQTVIVVEHDEEAILIADHVIDIGPNAGITVVKLLLKARQKK